ncbi:hypothetical protein JVT61DRAFT_4306 [Boletus reticuloceps]|uniref:Uncharacterized protein n=1 Tax=Boletus reticuloceps TaxID=495285 RepID=A0A8I2YKW2_9AGAM|nr:hypothetical protein JVT61DRAFT_4306 [Boletus reticuloceps]
MVIKLAKVDDKDCVKISDDLNKVQCTGDSFHATLHFHPQNTGDKTLVAGVKKLYGIPN